jgi:hypothetical protein
MTDDVALARALLDRARRVLPLLAQEDRGPSLAALDVFLAGPSPATFLGAMRVLGEARRHRLLSREIAAATPGEHPAQRSLTGGLVALRRIPSIPGGVLDRLADLPLEADTRQRLLALAALTRTYEELATRVAAATEDMRQRMRKALPRGRARRAARV